MKIKFGFTNLNLDPLNRNFEARKMRYDDFIHFEDTLSSYIDNPEKNKLQRHISEIIEVTPQLMMEGSEFKTNYENLRARQISQKITFEDILESLKISRLETKMHIEQMEKNILSDIQTNYNSFKNLLNQNNISVIASEINNYSTTVFNSMTDFQRSTNEDMRAIKSIYQTSIFTCNIQEKVAKPTLKDALKKKIILQTIPERSTLSKVLGGIGGMLMYVPFFPVKALGAAMIGGSMIKEAFDDQAKVNIVTENKRNITEKENETVECMKDFVNSVEQYVNEECKKMIGVIQFKMDFYKSYSEEMIKCCERLNVFP